MPRPQLLPHPAGAQAGLTLIELLIAIVIAALAITGMTRFFINSLRDYTSERSLLDIEQNGNNTMAKLAEVIMQIGSDIPDEDTVIKMSGSNRDDITIKENSRGAIHAFSQGVIGTRIGVKDAGPFFGETKVFKKNNTNPVSFEELTINTSYNTGATGFIAGIDTTHDSLCFTSSDTFFIGEAIYTAKKYRYFLDHAAAQFKVMYPDSQISVIADCVDSLSVKFLDSTKAEITQWANARLCSLSLLVRTPIPDPRYNGYADHRRRMRLAKEIFLRNKAAF